MGARTAYLLIVVAGATGVTAASANAVHAEISTECAPGTDTANLNAFIGNELGMIHEPQQAS